MQPQGPPLWFRRHTAEGLSVRCATCRQVAGAIDAQSPERDAGGVQRKRNLSGEIVLQPLANPDGTTQQLNGYFAGRNAFDGSGNFKRNWLDLTVTVVKNLDKHAW